ncbi:MAG: M64 family metallopeptidase [Bacteroidales bacterium]|jgi:hypothetical protein
MKKIIVLVLVSVLIVSCTVKVDKATSEKKKPASEEVLVVNKGNVSFDNYFLDKTMRFDYFHSGTGNEEHFAKDQIVSDGIWSGSKVSLLDNLNLGLYFFEIVDKESKVLLYSKGFASVFGEWKTTPEAKDSWGTFSESLRFPWPKKAISVILMRRDTLNIFRPIWTTDIDPSSRQVNPVDMIHTNKVDIISENGPADKKVDIVILGDGYARNEMEKFRNDAARLSGYLMGAEPFRSRSKDFNIRAIETPAETSGVTKPHHGIFKRTPLSVHYSSFDSERYALTCDNQTVRNIASQVPYDLMVIMINERTYGGGGIYNLYTTVSADNKFARYIMIHEMGHHIAGLADEYYTSAVSYEAPAITVEPWEPNVTVFLDKSNLKWKELVESGTPLPTPWNKDLFDKEGYAIQKVRDSLRKAMVPESVMEDLFTRQMAGEDHLFSTEKYRDKVGAFEGADYVAKGMYRPQIDCIMYTRHLVYCKVCQRAIENVIDQLVK